MTYKLVLLRHGDGWNPEKIQPDELKTRKAELQSFVSWNI